MLRKIFFNFSPSMSKLVSKIRGERVVGASAPPERDAMDVCGLLHNLAFVKRIGLVKYLFVNLFSNHEKYYFFT
jgi:hypothetical protein